MYAPVLVYMTCIVLLVSNVLLGGTAHTAERAHPFRIGALTESWGPTPSIVALRDGLLELGYRENEQFVLGVRFTQSEISKTIGRPPDDRLSGSHSLRILRRDTAGSLGLFPSSLSERKLDALFMAGFPPKVGNHALILANF